MKRVNKNEVAPRGGNKPKRKRGLTNKQSLTAEGVAQGKSLHRAALDAGYAPSTAKSLPYNSQENTRIREAVERRKAEAMRRAQVHTDVIVGSLVEIATSSLGDVLDEIGDFSLEKARENGVDHLIKKLEKTVRYDKEGERTENYKFEMYSRLDALSQLRDNFGMKQEARPNDFEETRRAEVERAIKRIMEREGVDQPTAAQHLLAELGDAPHLAPIVNQYVN